VQVVWSHVGKILFSVEPTSTASAVFAGIDEIQGLLAKYRPSASSPFLSGKEYPGAFDLAVAPFVGRLFAFTKGGLEPLAEGGASYKKLSEDPKYKVFREYSDALTSRPSWKATFDEEYVVDYSVKRIARIKAGN
jgi:glutathione S-transferase